jgi:hypothetical protein
MIPSLWGRSTTNQGYSMPSLGGPAARCLAKCDDFRLGGAELGVRKPKTKPSGETWGSSQRRWGTSIVKHREKPWRFGNTLKI